MRLLFVRHAIAMEREDFQRQSPGESDELRPLTEKGAKKMRQNAKGLAAWVEHPAVIVTSPLTRAMQTAEILHTSWSASPVVVCEHLKPDHDPESFLKWLRQRPESLQPEAVIVVIGHEPSLSSLVGWFVTGHARSFFEFKKGGACAVDFEHDLQKNRGRMTWLATPAMLRKL